MFAKTETVELEKLKIGLQQRLSRYMVDACVSVNIDTIMNGIEIEARGYVWAEKKSAQKQTITYPANWKEAFKERWFKEWMLEKWPVKYNNVCIDVKAIYPEFRASMPNEIYRLIIQRDDYSWKD